MGEGRALFPNQSLQLAKAVLDQGRAWNVVAALFLHDNQDYLSFAVVNKRKTRTHRTSCTAYDEKMGNDLALLNDCGLSFAFCAAGPTALGYFGRVV